MDNKYCCAKCSNRYHVDDNTMCCWWNPGCGVEPNHEGWYVFNAEQAKECGCGHHYPDIFGDRRYERLPYSAWKSIYHPGSTANLSDEYEEYSNKVRASRYTSHRYVLEYGYPDVGGYQDVWTEEFDTQEAAVAAAVKASKDPVNYNITVAHKYHNNRYNRDESEWVDWKNLAK